MDFPWFWNRKYTMNWFLLSLLNHHLDQLLERYSRLQPSDSICSIRMTRGVITITDGTRQKGRYAS